MNTSFNKLQTVKRRFFAMRNGVIADTLRKSGSPYKIIFGLNLPQIRDIASEFGHDEVLAAQLWENTTTRESMLLAPMLMDSATLSYGTAEKMTSESPDSECMDMLVHNLIKYSPAAEEFAIKLNSKENQNCRYAAMRLAWNIMFKNKELALSLANKELKRNDKTTAALANKIIDEINAS